jgi:hypothetical protein
LRGPWRLRHHHGGSRATVEGWLSLAFVSH